MVTITYAPLGPQYVAMQSLHYVRDDAVWLNMIHTYITTYLHVRMYAVSNFLRDQACKTRPRYRVKSHVLIFHSLAARLIFRILAMFKINVFRFPKILTQFLLYISM